MPLPRKEMERKLTEYERMARLLCKQFNHDPDQLVGVGQPELIHAPGALCHAVNVGRLQPLWTFYLPVARAALGIELR